MELFNLQNAVDTLVGEQLPFGNTEHNLFIDAPLPKYLPHVYEMMCGCAAPFLMTPYLHGARYLWKQR